MPSSKTHNVGHSRGGGGAAVQPPPPTRARGGPTTQVPSTHTPTIITTTSATSRPTTPSTASPTVVSGKNVQVVCRFRPRKADEPRDPLDWFSLSSGETNTVAIRNIGRDLDFGFDKVHGEESSQVALFEDLRHVVEGVLEGFSGSILSYGQTSSGKTHTMLGKIKDPAQCGVIPRTLDLIFEAMSKADNQTRFDVKASYVELYCERIQDLLDPTKVDLKIGETADTGVRIVDVTSVPVASRSDVLRLLKRGSANRSTSATKMNAESSRSHVLLEVTVTQLNFKTMIMRKGKLVLVDLAGSERVGKTGVTGGLRLEEAKKINKSLTFLGIVIKALADNAAHVPYRDSKLTRLLQESLAGSSRTALIICCAPEARHAPETVSTLRFGERARQIKIKAVLKTDLGIGELRLLITKAHQEIEELRTMLRGYQLGTAIPPPRPPLAHLPTSPPPPPAALAPQTDSDGEEDEDAEDRFVQEQDHERNLIKMVLSASLAETGREVDFDQGPVEERYEEDDNDDDDDGSDPTYILGSAVEPSPRPDVAGLDGLQDELSRITELLGIRDRDHAAMVAEVDRLQLLLAKANERCTQAEEGFADQVVEAATAKGEKAKVEAQLKQEMEQLSQTEHRLQEQSNEISPFKVKLQAAEQQLAQVNQAHLEIAEELKGSQDQVSRLEASLSSEKKDSADALAQAALRHAEVEAELAQVKASGEEAMNEKDVELRQAVFLLEAVQQELQQAKSDHVVQLSEVNAKAYELEQKLQAMVEKEAEVVERTLRESEEAKASLAHQEQSLQASKELIQQLQASLHAREEEVKEAEVKLVQQQEAHSIQLGEQSQQIQQLQASLGASHQQLERTNAEHLQHEESQSIKISYQSQQIQQLQVSLQASHQYLEETKASHVQQLSEQSQQIQQLQTSLEASHQELDIINAEHLQQLGEQSQQIQQLQASLEASHQELEKTKADHVLQLDEQSQQIEQLQALQASHQQLDKTKAEHVQRLGEQSQQIHQLQASLEASHQRLEETRTEHVPQLNEQSQQIQQLQASLQTHEEEVKKAEAKHSQQLGEYLQQMEQLKAALKATQQELEKIKAEHLQQLSEQLQQREQLQASLQASHQQLEETKAGHVLQLSEQSQQIQQLQTSLEASHQQLAKTKAEHLQQIQLLQASLEASQQELERTKAEHSQQLGEQSQQIEQLQAALQASHQQLEETKKEHSHQQESQSTKLSDQLQQIQQLQVSLESAHQELEQVRAKQSQLQAQCTKLEEESKSLRTHFATAEEKVSTASKQHKKEMQQLKSELRVKIDALKSSEILLHQVQESLKDVSNAKEKVQNEYGARLEELAQLSKDVDMGNGESLTLRDALDRAKVELVRALAEQDRLTGALANAHEAYHELQIKRDFANEAKLDTKQRAIDATEAKLQDAKATIVQLTQALEEAKNRLAAREQKPGLGNVTLSHQTAPQVPTDEHASLKAELVKQAAAHEAAVEMMKREPSLEVSLHRVEADRERSLQECKTRADEIAGLHKQLMVALGDKDAAVNTVVASAQAARDEAASLRTALHEAESSLVRLEGEARSRAAELMTAMEKLARVEQEGSEKLAKKDEIIHSLQHQSDPQCALLQGAEDELQRSKRASHDSATASAAPRSSSPSPPQQHHQRSKSSSGGGSPASSIGTVITGAGSLFVRRRSLDKKPIILEGSATDIKQQAQEKDVQIKAVKAQLPASARK